MEFSINSFLCYAGAAVDDLPENVVPITPSGSRAGVSFSSKHGLQLLTILFTDLVDSTQLQSDLGNVEAARLTELHRRIVRDLLAKYDAREIEWAGDSCVAVFTRPSDAVVFALQVQAAHRREQDIEAKLPSVRIGVHLGEIVVKKREDGGKTSEDLFGVQVSETARVMSVARGRQILCTRPVFDNARSALRGAGVDGLAAISWRNHGHYALKGSDEPVEICEVGEEGYARFAPPKKTDKCRKVDRPIQSRSSFLGVAAGGGMLIALLVAARFFLPQDTSQMRDPELMLDPALAVAPAPQPVQRFSISLPLGQALAIPGITSYSVAFSPDGQRLAYVVAHNLTKALAVRPLDQLEAVILPGTDGARNPFFSPDGQWIGFFTQPGGELKKVSVYGGAPVTLCAALLPLGAYWGEDGYITFAGSLNAGLMRVADSGGEPTPLTTLDGESGEIVHMFPAALPREDAILITTGTAPQISRASVQVVSLETGERALIADKAVRGRYVPTGHIVYVQEGAFMAVPFSVETLSITGPPVDITEERMATSDWPPRQFEFSMEGSLAFVPHDLPSEKPHAVVWIDREKNEETPSSLPPRSYVQVRLSPDNSRVASIFIGSHDIWTYDLARGMEQRFTSAPGEDSEPIWSPDSRIIAFSSARDIQFNIYVKDINSLEEPQNVFRSPQVSHPRFWSPDGLFIGFQTQHPQTGKDIGLVSLSDRAPMPLVATPNADVAPSLSHDGLLLAYVSDESGRYEVMVQPLREPERRVQVSLSGGRQPLWNPTRNELFYRDGSRFVAAEVTLEGEVTVSAPRPLFEDTFYGRGHDRLTYDVSQDGNRFLVICEPEGADTRAHAEGTELVIVRNWFEELRRLGQQEGSD